MDRGSHSRGGCNRDPSSDSIRGAAGWLCLGGRLFQNKACARRAAVIYTEGSSVYQAVADQQLVTRLHKMPVPSVNNLRKPRADALRNRERLLDAAKAVFSAGGPDASLEAVARRADVGIGTLYRHFPTRESLFEAVYRREVQQLADLAEHLKSEAAPVEALRRWLRSNVEFVATKKGMSAALALAVHDSSGLAAVSFDRLTKTVCALL